MEETSKKLVGARIRSGDIDTPGTGALCLEEEFVMVQQEGRMMSRALKMVQGRKQAVCWNGICFLVEKLMAERAQAHPWGLSATISSLE